MNIVMFSSFAYVKSFLFIIIDVWPNILSCIIYEIMCDVWILEWPFVYVADSTRKRLIPGDTIKEKKSKAWNAYWALHWFGIKSKVYKHPDDFKSVISRVKLSGWSKKETDHDFTLNYIAVFGWFLPDTHDIYYEHKRSLFDISPPSLCKVVQSFCVCPGLPETLHAVDPIVGILQVTKHSVPIAPELYCDDGPPFKVKVFAMSENCAVLFI